MAKQRKMAARFGPAWGLHPLRGGIYWAPAGTPLPVAGRGRWLELGYTFADDPIFESESLTEEVVKAEARWGEVRWGETYSFTFEALDFDLEAWQRSVLGGLYGHGGPR